MYRLLGLGLMVCSQFHLLQKLQFAFRVTKSTQNATQARVFEVTHMQ